MYLWVHSWGWSQLGISWHLSDVAVDRGGGRNGGLVGRGGTKEFFKAEDVSVSESHGRGGYWLGGGGEELVRLWGVRSLCGVEMVGGVRFVW